VDGVWPTTSTTSSCSFDSALRKKLLQFTLEITTKPPACLLFTFPFCSRSRGIIFDGRACNHYLVELWQLINTHLHTCTVYCLLQYQLLSSLQGRHKHKRGFPNPDHPEGRNNTTKRTLLPPPSSFKPCLTGLQSLCLIFDNLMRHACHCHNNTIH
jgi:hypothetical protein